MTQPHDQAQAWDGHDHIYGGQLAQPYSRAVDRVRREVQPASWDVVRQEQNATYRVSHRFRQVQDLARDGIDAVTDTHDYINQRAAGRHPALEAELRQIEMTVAHAVPLLIARYLGRETGW